MNMELSFEMTDEELEKLRKILTDGGVRHYILEISDNEKIDVVEYKEYKKIEKENQELKKQLEEKENQQKEFIEYLKDKEKQFDVMGDPINSGACLGILRKYKEIIGDKDERRNESRNQKSC